VDWEKDPLREKVGLPKKSMYFVGDGESRYGFDPEDQPHTVLDHNNPDVGVPSLWCHWTVETQEEQSRLFWDGAEKFYEYIRWLQFLNERFFKPWGLKLSGTIQWRGEEWGDTGSVTMRNGVLQGGVYA